MGLVTHADTPPAPYFHTLWLYLTHQCVHCLTGHQSPRTEPTAQFAEVELILEPSNTLDAVHWRTDDGNTLTDLFDGRGLQTCLHFVIPFLRGCVRIRVARHHPPAE